MSLNNGRTDLYSPIDLGDDLTPREIPVRFGGKNYVLREASVNAVCQYRNFIVGCTRMKDGKPDSVKDIADAEPLLISLCLFELKEVQGKSIPTPVPLPTIRSWAGRVMKTLFDRIKAISDLDLEEEETAEAITEKIDRLREQLSRKERGEAGSPAKKEPSSTTPSSA